MEKKIKEIWLNHLKKKSDNVVSSKIYISKHFKKWLFSFQTITLSLPVEEMPDREMILKELKENTILWS